MSAILKEEAHRLGRVFIWYTKIIVGGMGFATLFFFIFAGVKANYISLEILAAVLATVSIGLSAFFLYMYFRMSFRALGRDEFESVKLAIQIIELEELKKEDHLELSDNQMEEVRQRIAQEVMNLSESRLEAFKNQDYSYRLLAYSTSRLIGFVIAGAIRAFVYSGTESFMRKPQEDEVQKHIRP
jgi:hypothetical protein